MRLRTIGLLVIVALGLLVLAPPAAEAQRAIFVVRHAEQVDDSSDSPLSEAGHQRARALARVLKDAGIAVIYTSEFQRTIQTAVPVAAALGIQATVVPRRDVEGLIRQVRQQHEQDIVLLVLHSGSLRAQGTTVPTVLRALGHPQEMTIPRNEYDHLFVVIPKSEGLPLVLRLRY